LEDRQTAEVYYLAVFVFTALGAVKKYFINCEKNHKYYEIYRICPNIVPSDQRRCLSIKYLPFRLNPIKTKRRINNE